MKSYLLHEYRCDGCGKLIIKGILFKSYEEFKCGRCGKTVCFQGIANENNSDRYLLLTTRDGEIINASVSVQDNLGFMIDEIIGKNIGELYSDSKEGEADKFLSDKISKLRYLRWDAIHKSKNNDEIPVSVCFRSFQKDGYEYVLRIINKKIEIDNSINNQGTFDPKNYSDFAGEVNMEGYIVYIDNCIKEIIDYKPVEIVGRHLSEFLISEEIPWRNKNMEILFSKRQSYRIPSLKLVHKNGSIVDCECSSSPVYDDLGELVGYRVLCWVKH